MAADINAFGLALYRRLLGGSDGEARRQGRRHVAHEHRHGARHGARRGQGLDGAADGHAPARQRLGRPRQRHGIAQQILNGYNATWKDDEGTPHALSLNAVNRAFGQDGWSIQPSFLDRIGGAFGAGLALVDYSADPDAARDTINAWVARQTHDRIKKLLGPTDVTSATRLALVNAIYLKANWQHEFDPQRTVDRAFTTSLGASVRVPTMRMDRSQVVPLAHGTGWQATALPYTGADGSPLSMTLILPDRLDAFEAGLTNAKAGLDRDGHRGRAAADRHAHPTAGRRHELPGDRL